MTNSLSKTNKKGNNKRFPILILGNVDERKFKYAYKLFKSLSSDIYKKIQIDLYGHILNQKLAKKLRGFPFVSLKGFQRDIDFSAYKLLLSCSFIENLPISMLEALEHEVPILSFDIGGISELLEHEVDGILIDAFKLKEMEKELGKIVDGHYQFHFPKNKLNAFNWQSSAKLMLEEMRLYFHA